MRLSEIFFSKGRKSWPLRTPNVRCPWGWIDAAGRASYEHRDTRGSVTMVTDHRGSVAMHTGYYPDGEPWRTPAGHSRQLEGKERLTALGLNEYLYPGRHYTASTALFTTPDPLAADFGWLNPYTYCAANPNRFTDPTGMVVNVIGSDPQGVIKQLQASVGESIELSLDGDKLKYKKNSSDAELKGNAKIVAGIIDDKQVVVNMNTTTEYKTPTGQIFVGGAFMGNEVSKNNDGSLSATATQIVNPKVLNSVSNAHEKPGADMLHELTEAYAGGKISIKKGISSPKAGMPKSVYKKAHKRAEAQSGPIYIQYFDAKENELTPIGNEVPKNTEKARWSVFDQKGNRIHIQQLP